jgi:polyhydroxyalkanoate synthesis regulator phasin
MSPQEFLNIISYGEPGEGMSSKYELSVKGSDKYLPKNWRETYKQNKTSTTGFRGALNKGLDYIGVDPIFNMGGYYQDGGEQQVAQQVAQAMQQGMQPQEAMAMLVESGMTEDQAMQLVQAIMQQIQQQGQNPQEEMSQGTPQMRRGGGYYQQGGEAMDEQMEGEDEGAEGESAMLEQVEAQVEQALKQGADPQQVLQQLVEMGIPEEQAMQMVQEILQEIQGGETGMEAPEEATPQMSKGGKYMRALVGKTIKNYTYNPKTDSYTVSYE